MVGTTVALAGGGDKELSLTRGTGINTEVAAADGGNVSIRVGVGVGARDGVSASACGRASDEDSGGASDGARDGVSDGAAEGGADSGAIVIIWLREVPFTSAIVALASLYRSAQTLSWLSPCSCTGSFSPLQNKKRLD